MIQNSFPICPKSATKLFGLYHHHPLHNGEKTMLKKKNLQQKHLDWKWPSPTTSSPISKISRTMAQEGFLSWRPQQTLESGPVYILTCFRFQTPCCWQGAEWWTVPLTWSPAITWKRGRDRWKSWKRNTIWKQGWYSVIPHGLIFYARWFFFPTFLLDLSSLITGRYHHACGSYQLTGMQEVHVISTMNLNLVRLIQNTVADDSGHWRLGWLSTPKQYRGEELHLPTKWVVEFKGVGLKQQWGRVERGWNASHCSIWAQSCHSGWVDGTIIGGFKNSDTNLVKDTVIDYLAVKDQTL